MPPQPSELSPTAQPPAPHSFSARLRRQREAAGLTQEELAERAGLSVRGLKYLEQGARRPYPATVRRLAVALALAPEERAALEASARLAETVGAALPSHGWRAGPTDAPPLVGRVPERALLEQHLAGHGPPVLLLAGEPGIGKTRLLRAAAQQAHAAGWTVLAGGCSRSGGEQPFAPVLYALQDYLAARSTAERRRALRGCAWLVRLLPELPADETEPLPPWTLPPEQERRLMVDAVRLFLANAAGAAGTLLLLDDLQWAGSDALHMLASLVQRRPDRPLRVIGAYRPTELRAQDTLAALLADLASAGQVTHHLLGPLAHVEASQLLHHLLAGSAATTATRERIVQRADGVPFFLVSCARGLHAYDSNVAPGNVPWDVAQSVRQRVVALPASTKEILEAAAVVGRVAERAVLLAMLVQPRAAVLEALDAACQAGMLEEDGRTAYRFAHDILREVIEADLTSARYASLHQCAAEALERGTGVLPVEALAYHYAHSDALDKAATYLTLAGDSARDQHAHGAAEGYYRAAIERRDRLGRPHDAATAREALGNVLFTLNRNDEAIAALEAAATTYRAIGDTASVGRVSALIGWAHYRQGRPAEGLRRAEEALALPGTAGAAFTAATLHITRATCLGELGQFVEAVAAAERGVELAAACGDIGLEARAHSVRGGSLRLLGRLDQAIQAGDQARALAEQIGDLRTLCYELHARALRLLLEGDITESRSIHARLLAVADRFGSPQFALRPLTLHAFIATHDGQWGQARADIARGLRMVRALDAPETRAQIYCLAAQLCLAENAPARAARWLRRALALIGDAVAPEARPWTQRLLAEVDLYEGRPREARARIEPILASADQHDTVFMLPSLAWAHLQQGSLAEADRVARAAIARAQAERNRLALVDALRVRALIALEQDRWDEARCALDEGLELVRRSGYLPAEARLLWVYDQLHARTGQLAAAQE